MSVQEQTVLEIKNLQISFTTEGQKLTVVDGVSYQLPKGRILAVVGESGCGKTVHALSILRLLAPNGQITDGEINYCGQNLRALSLEQMRDIRGKKISMIFQDPMTSLNPVYTVGEQITETILAHTDLNKEAAKKRTLELLTKVGIAEPEKRYDEYPFQFSGGMRQRVMIAIALCLDPDILIADEPTTALDVTIQAQILKLIKELQRGSGMSAIFITHNLAIVADIADQVLVLYAGRVVEQADTQTLFASPLHPYTRGLLSSLVTMNRRAEKLPAIEGNPPMPGQAGPGCPFAPRCPHVMNRCRREDPPLYRNGEHKVRCFLVEQDDVFNIR